MTSRWPSTFNEPRSGLMVVGQRLVTPRWPSESCEERFWAKVEKTDSCWLWKAGALRNGYGQFWNGSRSVAAHRMAYEAFVGPIPAGLDLDHLCRVRNCVNPDHLEPVTRRENQQRGVGVNSINARKTHCPYGHPYDEENTCYKASGRACRECTRQRARRRYWAAKAARMTRWPSDSSPFSVAAAETPAETDRVGATGGSARSHPFVASANPRHVMCERCGRSKYDAAHRSHPELRRASVVSHLEIAAKLIREGRDDEAAIHVGTAQKILEGDD